MNTRSIPACAGEPSRSSSDSPARGVYPRVCGGTWTWPSLGTLLLGLSPRVRGNHGADQAQGFPYGSIPACAGEPRIERPTHRNPGVYPRVCGGTKPENVWYQQLWGLSPRVRGNPIVVWFI